MEIDRERTHELEKKWLFQDEVHKVTKLDDDLFNRYLAFLDVLIEHQVEQEQYQDSLE